MTLTADDRIRAAERIAFLWDLPLTAVFMWRRGQEDLRQIPGWICLNCGALRALRYCRHDMYRYYTTTSTAGNDTASWSGVITLHQDWRVS